MAQITYNSRFSRFKFYYQDAYYHIYNRGNGRNKIFLDDSDYNFYLNRLRQYLAKHKVILLCYCLMPNHIHLLVQQTTPKPIYKFISSLHTSYSIYFNKKYKHVGHVFQDRYKQIMIETDEYLLYLCKYIHLNPFSEGLVKKHDAYKWSSLNNYICDIKDSYVNTDIILSYFNNSRKSYKKYLSEKISEETADVLKEIVLEPF